MNNRVIFIIPYAGGSFYSMRGLEEKLNNIDCITLELPGRGKRINEPLSRDLDYIVNDLYERIIIQIERYDEYFIFGHSMGSLLSYLLIQKIIVSNFKKPKHLFVSGNGGPSQKKKHEDTHLLSQKNFWEKLKDLGGMPSEITESIDLMSVFEPILRSDFELLNNYNYVPNKKFSIPITVFYGSNENIEIESLKLWQDETEIEIDILEFVGDHFYIFENWDNLSSVIMDKIDLEIKNKITLDKGLFFQKK